jgi:Phage integrase, N-terminal SAM-like domain
VFGVGSGGCVPDGERFPCLTYLFMDPLGPDPLIRSFERHLYAENRSARTVTTYLIAVRRADTFLRERGASLETATRSNLEAFLGDLLARRRLAPRPPTTRSSRSSTAGCRRRDDQSRQQGERRTPLFRL